MSIDDSGDMWTGTEPADIPIYLSELTQGRGSYPATEFRHVQCGCESDRFRLVRSLEMTQRTCVGCGQVGFISRGKNALPAWEEAIHEETPEPFRCAGCGADEANVCVGFAGYPEAPELQPAVKWFYVGIRCCACGVLCSFNNGKVGRLPPETVYPEVTGEAELSTEKSKRGRKRR